MRSRTFSLLVGVLTTVLGVALPSAGAAATSSSAAPALTLHGPALVRGGHPAVLSGTLAGAPSGTSVRLYRVEPPAGPQLIRTTATGTAGGFTFTVFPDRTMTLVAAGGLPGASARMTVQVLDPVRVQAVALPLGRAEVALVLVHPRSLRWNGARVRWTFTRGRRTIAQVAGRTTVRSIHATFLRVVATLPAGTLRWSACFSVPDATALADPGRPRGCAGRGYTGTVRLPDGYPGPGAIARAIAYLAGRTGRTGLAVVDSEGRLTGWHEHWRFVSASVVKAMLLVAYLRRLARLGYRSVPGSANSFLYPMINVSDNSAATTTWSIVGDGGLYDVARAAGMTDFSIAGIWANAQISAADQARFFFEMDSLIPPAFVGYARGLLSTIAGYESWGIPAVARPRGYTVFFKGGWRGTSLGQLVHQVGRLEGHRLTFAMAVMTDGDPSMGYGIDTIQGVAARLL